MPLLECLNRLLGGARELLAVRVHQVALRVVPRERLVAQLEVRELGRLLVVAVVGLLALGAWLVRPLDRSIGLLGRSIGRKAKSREEVESDLQNQGVRRPRRLPHCGSFSVHRTNQRSRLLTFGHF